MVEEINVETIKNPINNSITPNPCHKAEYIIGEQHF